MSFLPNVNKPAVDHLQRLSAYYDKALVFSTAPEAGWWTKHFDQVAEISLVGKEDEPDNAFVQTLSYREYEGSVVSNELPAAIRRAVDWLGGDEAVIYVAGRRRTACAMLASSLFSQSVVCLANSNRPRYARLHALLDRATEWETLSVEPDERGENGIWEFKSWSLPREYYQQYNLPVELVGELAFHTSRFAEILPLLSARKSEGSLPVLTGVEIGVYQGGHAEQILETNPFVQLTAIDMFDLHAKTNNTSYTVQTYDKTARRMGDPAHAEFSYQTALQRLARFGKRVQLVKADSANAVRDFSSLDFVYIDGDHSYRGCKADIERWWPVVRPGGWLAGHDFGVPRFGVSDAVADFAKQQKLPVLVNAASHGEWIIRKPC